MVGVEQWAEIRRLHFVRGLSMREIHRRTGLHRDTISRAVRGAEPPVYRRVPAGSKLDPFKSEIHRLMSGLAKEGKAILMVSSEMPEILGMSDRVLVMAGGRITAEFARDEVTQEKVLEAATFVAPAA